jgi:N-acyl-D-aspartate/D-glutamate deacylase
MLTTLVVALLLSSIGINSYRQNPPYDVVIMNGRVMNPESGLDSTGLNIGIRGDSIAVITREAIVGKRIIDATGLIVAPGFIDILSYNPNQRGVWNKIADGVTTNLAMHGGTAYPESWYARFEKERPPVNFGASFFYTEARNTFGLDRYQSAQPHQIEKLVTMAEEGLNKGCLGISFSLEYVPGISADEIRPMMHLAARYSVPVFFHLRYSDMEEPGTNIEATNEVIDYARESGAAVHIDHINSTGGTFSMSESLALIERARAEGLDITACTYPYNFWGTYLNSARFDRGWQKRFRISYEDLQIAGTTERLTKETFDRYRKEGKLAVAYAIPEEDVVAALRSPFVMIGSDAILTSGNNHPRASGAFARTIALYVREKNTISLMEALAKMTIMPARRLEQSSPAMKRKGRLTVGADADIVLFSFEEIQDRATVERPDRMSEGIRYVLVGGSVVKDPSGLKRNVRAGKAIRRSIDDKTE